MKSKEIRSQLRELVPDFAKRVAPIYKQLSWEWQPGKVRFIPTEEDIVAELYRMIDELGLTNGDGSLATGGLKVFSEAPSDFDTCWHIGMCFELKHEAIIGTEGRCISTPGKC